MDPKSFKWYYRNDQYQEMSLQTGIPKMVNSSRKGINIELTNVINVTNTFIKPKGTFMIESWN